MSDHLHVKLGLIGFGNMAEAVLKGIIAQKVVDPRNIWVTDQSESRRLYLRNNFPVQLLHDNRELLRRTDVVLIAVKPNNIPALLKEIAPEARPDHLFLSVCAGVRTATFEAGLRNDATPKPRVVRIMPNTPALIGKGMAGICEGSFVHEDDLNLPFRIFRAVGEAVQVEEDQMDAVTALTGSGPAYVFYLIEALIQGGVDLGFPPDQAKQMVLQMVLGSATLAKNSDKEPEELRRAVTSPGGTTAAAISVLDSRGVKQAFRDCLAAAEARGRELGQANK